jgi:hypothetical protein
MRNVLKGVKGDWKGRLMDFPLRRVVNVEQTGRFGGERIVEGSIWKKPLDVSIESWSGYCAY